MINRLKLEAHPMKIHVNRIPSEGVREEMTYDPKALDVDREDVQVAEPVALSSFITKTAETLVVMAEISSQLRLTCARCLEEFDAPLHTTATLTYDVAPTDVVDITEDIRQEMILAYPKIPVCRADCRGLCLVCGQNLNHASCPHQPE